MNALVFIKKERAMLSREGVYEIQIRFVWPSEQLEMTMRFGEFITPELSPDRAQRLFTRQDLSNLPGFDLATWTPDDDLKKVRGSNP